MDSVQLPGLSQALWACQALQPAGGPDFARGAYGRLLELLPGARSAQNVSVPLWSLGRWGARSCICSWAAADAQLGCILQLCWQLGAQAQTSWHNARACRRLSCLQLLHSRLDRACRLARQADQDPCAQAGPAGSRAGAARGQGTHAAAAAAGGPAGGRQPVLGAGRHALRPWGPVLRGLP